MNKEMRKKKYEQIRENMMFITRAKDDTLYALIALGKKMGPFRYLMIAVLFVFLFVFHMIFNFFIQMKLREKFARVMATTMSMVLIITSISIPTYAAENILDDDSQTLEPKSKITYIKGFETLDEWITMQYVREGGNEENIYFPDEIKASVFVISEENNELQDDADNLQGGANEGEPEGGANEGEPEGGANEGEPEGGANEGEPEGGANEDEPEGGANEGEPEGGANEGEPEGGANEDEPKGGANEGEPESGANEGEPEGEANEGEPEGEANPVNPVIEANQDNMDDMAFGGWKISTVAVKMPIFYSEPNVVQMSTITEDTNMDIAVDWKLKGDIPFDASIDRIKSDYEYEMVLPDGFELTEGVEMPVIRVHIEAPVKNVVPIADSGSYEQLKITNFNGNTIKTSSDPAAMLDAHAGFYDDSFANDKGISGGAFPKKSLSINGVTYSLPDDYAGKDSIYLTYSEKEAEMTLESKSAYERIYILAVAGGVGSSTSAKFEVTLEYASGNSTKSDLYLHDWFNNSDLNNKYAGVMRFQSNGVDGSTTGAPYLQQVYVNADPSRVLQSIKFKYCGESSDLCCAVYAVTGKFAAGVPTQATTVPTAVDISTNAFTLNWSNLEDATGYYIDVATDSLFTEMVEGYNNKQLSSDDYSVEDSKIVYQVGGEETAITKNKTYYVRVRPYNEKGQGPSSPTGNITTLDTPVVRGDYEPLVIRSESLNHDSVRTSSDINSKLDNSAGFYDSTYTGGNSAGALPNDGRITMESGVPYDLPSYTGNDCIRVSNSLKSAEMILNSLSAYDRIYVLATAGGVDADTPAPFSVTLTYTDGTITTGSFILQDWFYENEVEGIEKYKHVMRVGDDNIGSINGAPYLQSVSVDANQNKVLQKITFTYDGSKSGLYCGVYGVTGKFATGVPNKATTKPIAVDITSNAFKLNWSSLSDATGYYIDVATDETFTTMVDGYNNKQLSPDDYKVENNKVVYQVGGKNTAITDGVTYYVRVRPYNENGQGASSPTGNVTTLIHTHSLIEVPEKPVTCTTEGNNKYYTCECGKVFKANGTTETTVEAEKISALDHAWSGEWTTIKEATATEEGRKITFCTRGCGQKKIVTILKIGEDDIITKFEKAAEVGPNAPIKEATLNNTKDKLLTTGTIFTDEEKQAINRDVDAVDARVWLEVSKIENDNEAEITAIEAEVRKLGANENITYFDASLFKKVGTDQEKSISDTGMDIEISIKIPSELLNTNSKVKREYKLLRYHEGEGVTVITGSFSNGEFTFKTNKFSTYAIIYTDTAIAPSGGGNSGGNSNSSSGSDNSSTPAPVPSTTPTPITVPVSNGESDNVVHINATISGETAKVSEFTADEINKIANNETETKSIEINLSETGNNVKEAALPVSSLNEIVRIMDEPNNKLDNITIKLSTATVEVSEHTLKAVLSKTTGNDLRLVVDDIHKDTLNNTQKEAVKNQNVHQCIDAYFISNGVRIGDFQGGTATIRLPFNVPEGLNGNGFSVWYVGDDGTIEKHDTEYVNGELVFTVSHFSDYVVVYDGAVKDDVPKTGEAADYTTLVWTSILAIGVLGLALNRQKRRQ